MWLPERAWLLIALTCGMAHADPVDLKPFKASYTIEAATQRMATDYSMFEGWEVSGNAKHVFSRGEMVVKDGEWIGETGRGRFLKREANAGGFA